ncbi:MAG: ParB/RepB/Spo0J family partition protein [Defluviitaleaceae bacterium]|nr:ParB/RepB/Spo0J family partition protein [Defluviitaleaceae bacterium]
MSVSKKSDTQYESEKVVLIPLDKLQPPEFHPFQVKDDEAMKTLVENIKENGVMMPGIVRPRSDGDYELVAGNRRKRACELAGLVSMPVLVREMDDATATIIMVDTNISQREKLLCSERAWAYWIKMQALGHKGIKDEKQSIDVLVEQTGESRSQIFRLMRLTELIVELMDKVDAKQLAFNPAVELSYLSKPEQKVVLSTMEKYGIKPSLSQALQLKKLKQSGELSEEKIGTILSMRKISTKTSNNAQYRKFFPPGYTAKQMDDVIVGLLQDWQATSTTISKPA